MKIARILKHIAFALAFLLVLGLVNGYSLLARLYQEILASDGKYVYLLFGVLLLWLLRYSRTALVVTLLLAGLVATGTAQTVQKTFAAMAGLGHLPPKNRFWCYRGMQPASAQMYRVQHLATGVNAWVMLGKTPGGELRYCAASAEYLPVVAVPALEKVEQESLDDLNIEQYMQSSQLRNKRVQGQMTLMLMPSLRLTSYRVPFTLYQGQIQMQPGRHEVVYIY